MVFINMWLATSEPLFENQEASRVDLRRVATGSTRGAPRLSRGEHSKYSYIVLYGCGPRQNRTVVSAMRMQRLTTGP